MAAHLAHAPCATSIYLSASPPSSLNGRHHQEPADAQMSFTSEHHPSVGFAILFLEFLQTRWEELLDDEEFAPVHHGIEAGLKNLSKWYCKLDEMDVYFICLGKCNVSVCYLW